MASRQIIAPKNFRASYIIEFINECEVIFNLIEKDEEDFYFNLSKIKKIDMVGVLLVYKFFEFTVKNKCFLSPKFEMSSEFSEALEKYGFTNLILSYIDEKSAGKRDFRSLKISVTDRFIIAPTALLRDDKYSSEILNDHYLPQIENYYKNDPKAVKMIFTCFSEVLLNFWEHAVDDTQSIIVANGNSQNIEIACADNGNGIVSTLKNSRKGKPTINGTLLAAIEKGVTSKDKSNHMGFGLWIIDEIVRRTNGRFHLYSEGGFYQRENSSVKSGLCGYWKGTIVFISIPIRNPVTLADIETSILSGVKININWS
jgi:hypothetical protein